MNTETMPEFSRMLELEDIARGGVHRSLEATSDERASLARRLEILSIEALSADLKITLERDGEIVAIAGTLSAEVTQECVVTLEPVNASIRASIREKFARTPEIAKEIVIDPEREDEIDDYLTDNRIDLGEMVAQCLSLEIEPYPRKEGVDYGAAEASDEEGAPEGPFARLAQIRRNET